MTQMHLTSRESDKPLKQGPDDDGVHAHLGSPHNRCVGSSPTNLTRQARFSPFGPKGAVLSRRIPPIQALNSFHLCIQILLSV
jgi:hypothetical protein